MPLERRVALFAMSRTPEEWLVPARIDFHLNGGFTNILTWAGGPLRYDIATASIPPSLRRIGTWVTLRVSKGVIEVVGSAELRDWPWRTRLPLKC
jgi:hypothetical protein